MVIVKSVLISLLFYVFRIILNENSALDGKKIHSVCLAYKLWKNRPKF